MAEAARYLFDRAFDAPTRRTESEEAVAARQLQEEWERKLAEACCTAYEEGRAEGEEAARQSLAAQTQVLVGDLLQRVEQTLQDARGELDRIRSDAIEIGSLTANVLAEQLIERSPALNLEAVFAEALEHLDDAPHIAVTVNDVLVDEVQKLVSTIAAERGFTGDIVVLGDPDTTRGDCNLQWADGGLTVDVGRKRAAVAQIVRRHLESLNASHQTSPSAVTPAEPEQPVPGAEALPEPHDAIEGRSETTRQPHPIQETPDE